MTSMTSDNDIFFEKNLRNKRLWRLLIIYTIVCMSGCLILSSITMGLGAQSFYVKKNILGILLGYFAIVICFLFPISLLKKLFPWHTGIAYLSLLGLFLFGCRINGATSWYRLGYWSLQPSELFKPTFVVLLAWTWCKLPVKKYSLKHFLAILLFAALTIGPIVLQPDYGTSLIYLSTFMAVIFCGGCKIKYLLTTLLVGSLAMPLVILKHPYIQKRMVVFVDTLFGNASSQLSYHTLCMQNCMIKGGWFGSLFSPPAGLTTLPLRYNDSFFAAATELIGVVGIIPIILLFLAWLFYCCVLAMNVKSTFHRLVFIGAGTIISSQAFLHLGVNTSIFPNTGVTLPLMSYGSSSILSTAIVIAIVERLSCQESG